MCFWYLGNFFNSIGYGDSYRGIVILRWLFRNERYLLSIFYFDKFVDKVEDRDYVLVYFRRVYISLIFFLMK